METQTEKRTASGGLSCELDLGNTVKHRETTFEGKGNLPNHQVIFSLSNAITGPNLILMPLLFMQTGIVASVILGVFFGYISYKTCYLTIMHVKPNEPEFLYTISRTIGKFWMWVYLIIVILDLWLVCVIFSVSLVDTLFPGIYSIIYSHEIKMDPTSMPDASIINFHEFSAQWVSVAVAILLLICVSFKDVTKIVKLSSHGELGIIIAAIFLIYLGIKSIAQGKIDLTFDRDETQASTPLFSYNGLWTLIGFYSAAYLLHFMAVPILRTGAEPAKKRTNLYLAYVATGLIYLITGVFGALGIYWRIPPSDGSPSTIFGSYFYQETDIFVLSIITQVAVAFQLITVLPVINYITKNQIFSYIWRKEDGETVPDWAFHGYNVIFVIVMLVCMIYNVSPTTLMGYVGTFGGFIIVYLVPILIHLKSQKIFLGRTDEKAKAKESFFQQERQMSIVEQVHQEEAHISPIQLNIFYIGIIFLGVVLVVVNIALAANAPFTQ